MAIAVTAEQLGLNPIEKDKVYGIVSEMDMQGTILTVVAFMTGDTSVYMSSGAIIIGAGQHDSVKKVVIEYVKIGQSYLNKAVKIQEIDLPNRAMTNFNFLTENGAYRISQSSSELESGKSEFFNLFAGLNNVITEVRLKSE